MRIFYRYILKEVLPPSLLSLVVFSFVLLINILFQLAEMIVEQGLSVGGGLLYFACSLPSLFSVTIPVSVLSGVLVAVSRLSAEREITAMRACGMNISRLLKPLAAFGALLSGVLLLFNFWLIPVFASYQEKLSRSSFSGKMITRSLQPNQFFDRIPGLLIYVKDFDPAEQKYRNLLIYQNPKEGIESLTVAESAKVLEDRNTGEIGFIVSNGKTCTFKNKTPGNVDILSFNEQVLKLQTAQKPASAKKDLVAMPAPILLQRAFPQIAREADDELFKFRYEFSRRAGNSLIVIVFILLAFPLGIANIGGGKGASFSLSILLVLLYWVMQSALGNLALKGRLQPEFAAWSPLVILLAVSFFLNIKGGEKMWRVREWFGHLALLRKLSSPEEQEVIKEKGGLWGFYSIKTLDKYLLSMNLKFFSIVLLSLLALNWIIETRGLIGYISNGRKAVLYLKYLGVKSVGIMPVLAPFAILITVLIVAAVLERRSELTAIKASGISLFRVSANFLVTAFLLSLAILLLQETVMPGANLKAIRIKDNFKNFYSRHLASDEDVWLFNKKDAVLYHYNYYNRKEKFFQAFSVYFFDKETLALRERFRAKRVEIESGNTISFRKGWWWRDAGEKSYEFRESGTMTIPNDKDFLILPPYLDAETLSMKKLRKLIDNLSEKGITTARLSVEYYRKIADGFASFVLVLIGLPFAFQGGRRGSLYGISIALGLSLFYYTVSAVFKSVGQMEWLDPSLASLFPMFLFSIVGAMLLLKIRT
ncbi:MAG TPA: LptF/LptG family permease [Acidobacteriota bacterium]|nr:LptF/LptG family permease [Acidobacteriota bacterium]HNT18131.1 LptF/LptG family permease [Acidobacteriota bacterium]HPA27102.1 LptF/LptG family permease [Acidobacteriota bacterium]HQO20758.1 LptF/LptG family permease [Acidobacteriota bacterium]HQQ47568.1 LptF/LptG family permease [Acidobacteriota bacterium]